MSHSESFLTWLADWKSRLAPVSLGAEIVRGDASGVAVLVVDLVVGFCSEGPLASPRVGALCGPASELMEQAHAAGVRHFLLACDAHPPDSLEFAAFPPHCIAGTREADVDERLRQVSFFDECVLLPKRSVNVGLEPAFGAWLDAHPEVTRWIVIGDCTDICVYHAAMHLRCRANMTGAQAEVWVPAELVDTFDLPVPVAAQIGALPHDGDLLHDLFLYHLALNGIRVVSRVDIP